MPDAADVRLDPAAAYPEVGEVSAALQAGDWPAVRTVLDRVTPRGRSLLLRLAGDEEGHEDLLRGVLAADPDDTAAAAMLGFHLIDVGWKVRSGARAKYVSREQFSTFHDWLRQAERILIDAAARNPADLAVWSARLVSARGLQLGLSEVRRRYDRLRAIDPHNYQAQGQFLQTLCPKWSGTWEQLYAWTREEMLAAPPGSLQGALVAMGHIERWLDHEGTAQRTYFANPQVRADLHEAANRSIWHPDFHKDFGWVQAVGTFAMAFSLGGDEASAGTAFVLLGDLGSEHPWNYLKGGAATAIVRRRTRALAAIQKGPAQ